MDGTQLTPEDDAPGPPVPMEPDGMLPAEQLSALVVTEKVDVLL